MRRQPLALLRIDDRKRRRFLRCSLPARHCQHYSCRWNQRLLSIDAKSACCPSWLYSVPCANQQFPRAGASRSSGWCALNCFQARPLAAHALGHISNYAADPPDKLFPEASGPSYALAKNWRRNFLGANFTMHSGTRLSACRLGSGAAGSCHRRNRHRKGTSAKAKSTRSSSTSHGTISLSWR